MKNQFLLGKLNTINTLKRNQQFVLPDDLKMWNYFLSPTKIAAALPHSPR